MTDNETTWDKLLQIKTTGRDDSNSDQYRYPYEPTPYSVLERLANSGLIRKKDVVLDYGCGKGRVDFFLSYQTKANTIGIEYDERIYESAIENQKTGVSKVRTQFVLARADIIPGIDPAVEQFDIVAKILESKFIILLKTEHIIFQFVFRRKSDPDSGER